MNMSRINELVRQHRSKPEFANPKFRVRLIGTDTSYFSQFGALADELGDGYAENVVAGAKAHGYSPSHGEVYINGLADFTGDPKAFFSRADGTAAIKRRIEERGTGCRGKWDIEPRKPDHDPLAPEHCTALAPDIVENIRHNMIREDPGLARENQDQLRKQIVKKHGRQTGTPKPLRKEK